MVVRLCVIHSCRDRFTTHPTYFPPKCYQSPNPSGCVVSCFCITSDSPRAGSIPNIYMSMCVWVCNTVRKRKRNGRQEIHTHTHFSPGTHLYYFLLFCVCYLDFFFLWVLLPGMHWHWEAVREWMGLRPVTPFSFLGWGPFPLYRDVPQRTWLWVRLHNLFFFCVCVS
jgi:hypothetical protein